MAFQLHRRSFLRGLGGIAIALPALEIMNGRRSMRPHHRSATSSAWQAFRLEARAPTQNLLVPDKVGAEYDAKTVLAPLADLGLTSEVTVVSGLQIPTANGGSIPAGGRHDTFHTTAPSALLWVYEVETGPTARDRPPT